ncbi:MAG TPA: sugar phosphate nucleotidyltransferase [Candidatus Dormibacteraeota bacterium]|nr:sugar phosphate nucleotidyltransferase [Candidatus Dormibacteraeota bacterium]
MARITKAVIAAAGFGTRFLPQTKAMPKEMLPLVDKPIIQQIVEELVAAGITDIVIITGYHKRTIEDHFDYMSADLRANLKQSAKLELLEATKKISNLANFAYIRQKGPYGTTTPLLNAAHLIGDEPFIYTYADDFVVASPSRFQQLLAVYQKYQAPVLTCVRRDQASDYLNYGYVSGRQLEPGVLDVETIIEKPGSRKLAPSSLASVSGYLLEPTILDFLQRQMENHKGPSELRIQDVMQQMINQGHHFYAREIENSKHYDTGNPLEYIKTVFDFALARDDMGPELRKYMRKKLS